MGGTNLRPPRGRLPTAAAGAVSVGAGVVTALVVRGGLGLGPDGVTYVSTGINLAAGRGLRGSDGAVLTMFPPGLPLLVALGDLVGASPSLTLGTVNVCSVVAVGLLVHLLVVDRCRSAIVGLGAVAVAVFGVPVLTVTRMAWSEPPFLVVVLAVLVVLDRRERFARPWMVVGALAGLVWLAFAVKYSALALIPVVAVALALEPPRVRLVGSFVVAAMSAPALWMLRNHGVDGMWTGERPPSIDGVSETVRRLGFVIGGWLVPDPAPGRVKTAAYLGLAVIVVIAAGWSVARLGVARVGAMVRPVAPLVVFVGVYGAYLVVTQLSTAIDPLDTRLASPLWAPLVVLAAVALDGSLARTGDGVLVRRCVGVVATLLLVVQLGAFVREATSSTLADIRDGVRSPASSELVAGVAALPAGTTLYSNGDRGLWEALRGTPAADLVVQGSPRRTPYRSDLRLPVPASFLDSACRRPYLAWFDMADFHLDPDELADHVSLTTVDTFADGTIYRIGPLPGATRRC